MPPPQGYEKESESTYVKRDAQGRVTHRATMKPDGGYNLKEFYLRTRKQARSVQTVREENYDAQGQLHGTRRTASYTSGAHTAHTTTVEVYRHGELVRADEPRSHQVGREKYTVTLPSGETVQTSSLQAVKAAVKEGRKPRAQEGKGLYEVQYAGKKWSTPKKGFEPEEYKRAKEAQLREGSAFERPSTAPPVRLQSEMQPTPVRPERFGIRAQPTPKPQKFEQVTGAGTVRLAEEKAARRFTPAPPVTLDVRPGKATAETVKQSEFFTKEGVPTEFKFADEPTPFQKIVERASRRWEGAEKKVSEFIFPGGRFDPGCVGERIGKKTGVFKEPSHTAEYARTSDTQLAGGIRQQITKRPLETTATVAGGYALGAGAGAARYAGVRLAGTRAAMLVPPKAAGVIGLGAKATPTLLGAGYAGVASHEVLTAPKREVALGRELVRVTAFGFGAKAAAPVTKRFGFLTSIEKDIQALPRAKQRVARRAVRKVGVLVAPEKYTVTTGVVKGDVELTRGMRDIAAPKQPYGYPQGVLLESSVTKAEVKVAKKVGELKLGERTYKVEVAGEKMISQRRPEFTFRTVARVEGGGKVRVFLGGGEGELHMRQIGKAQKFKVFAEQKVPVEISRVYRVAGFEKEKLVQVAAGQPGKPLKLKKGAVSFTTTHFGGKLEEAHFPIYAEVTGKRARLKPTKLYTGRAKAAYVLGQRQTVVGARGATGEVGAVAEYHIRGTPRGRFETGKGAVEGLVYPEVVPNEDLILEYRLKVDKFGFVPKGKKAQVSVGRVRVKSEAPKVKLERSMRVTPPTGGVTAEEAARLTFIEEAGGRVSRVALGLRAPVVGVSGVVAPKVAAKPIVKPVVKSVTRSVLKPVVKPAIKPVLKPVTKPIIKPVVKTVVKPVTKPVLKPVTKPITKPLQKTIQKPITRPPLTSTFTPTIITPPPPPITRWKYTPQWRSQGKGKAPRYRKPKVKYTPTLYATTTNLRAKLTKRRKKKEMITGLTARPLPLRVKRRRKK